MWPGSRTIIPLCAVADTNSNEKRALAIGHWQSRWFVCPKGDNTNMFNSLRQKVRTRTRMLHTILVKQNAHTANTHAFRLYRVCCLVCVRARVPLAFFAVRAKDARARASVVFNFDHICLECVFTQNRRLCETTHSSPSPLAGHKQIIWLATIGSALLFVTCVVRSFGEHVAACWLPPCVEFRRCFAVQRWVR